MALCTTTALAGAVSRLCVRGARGRFGGVRAGTWCCVSPSSPFPPRVSRVACGGPSRPGVPYPRSLVRHSMWSVRSARSVRLPFWWSPRVLFVCVRSRSRGVRSPLGGVARASRVVPAVIDIESVHHPNLVASADFLFLQKSNRKPWKPDQQNDLNRR